MAIIFIEKTKKQKYLIYIFLLLVLITVFIVWKGYFLKEKPLGEIIFKPTKKIKIDFNILKNPALNQLQPIEKIKPIEIGVGRENPFIPY